MADRIDWIAVRSEGGGTLGAVGFIGNALVAIAAFTQDTGGDTGSGGAGSSGTGRMPSSLRGEAVVQVALQAREQMDILRRDAAIQRFAAQLYPTFAAGLVAPGIAAAYFARGVGMVGGRIGAGMVKQLVIRKDAATAVKQAMLAPILGPAARAEAVTR